MPRIHRGEDARRASTSVKARAFTSGNDVFIPAEHGPLDTGPGAALLAHELTHVRQQRQLGSALPPEGSAEGKRLEADARSAESTYGPPPLMTLPRLASHRSGARDGSDGESASTAGPDVATTISTTSETAGAHAGSAAGFKGPVQRATRARRPSPRSDDDLDDLARQLYGRLRDRLRRELLVDRERAGMVTDLR